MVRRSLFRKDLAAEHALAEFLDEHLYPQHAERAVRLDSMADQLAGKDLLLDWGGMKGLVVDEKATLHYLNRNLPTFAFELGYLKDGDWRQGWLLDPHKQTAYYMLLWPNARVDRNPSKADFTEVEAMLISRRAILNGLKRQGWDGERLMELEAEVRESRIEGKLELGLDWMSANRNTVLSEQPVNIVIRKTWLSALAVWHGHVP